MRIPLKVQGVTDINASQTASLLILTDMQEEKQIAIVTDANKRYEFAVRRGKYIGDDEHRRIANEHLEKALPETLSAIIKYMTGLELAVVITGLNDGEYKTVIEDMKSGTVFPVRASDGVLLSYADPHIPLFIEEALWERQSMKYLGADAKGVSMPLNSMSESMLKQALEKCVEEERYELAEQLKNELERRNRK